MPRFTLHFQLQRYPYGDSAVCTMTLHASKPYCNASRAFDVLANPFLDTGLSLGSHTVYVLGMATRCSLQEDCWELQHKPLWSFGPPNFFNSLLGCEDEFKSALQPINGLRNQQYYG